jgi:drug/metabolite transporter (DMT)-like permease
VLKGKSNASLAPGSCSPSRCGAATTPGTKWLVGSWPPIFTGGTRFLCAGLLLLAVLRVTTWFGEYVVPSRELNHALWLRGGLSLAAYIMAFNYALRFTSASHVALYLGASPVWALLWEALQRADQNWLGALGRGVAGVEWRWGVVGPGAGG